MPKKITAKFSCWEAETKPHGEQINCLAVADDSETNKAWSEATPAGQLTMTISNPGAQGFFQAGKEYIVEIREAGEGE
jgi:hypothetical protein